MNASQRRKLRCTARVAWAMYERETEYGRTENAATLRAVLVGVQKAGDEGNEEIARQVAKVAEACKGWGQERTGYQVAALAIMLAEDLQAAVNKV